MSKTDKTRPTWVQVMDPHNKCWLEVYHVHHRGTFRRPLDNCTYDESDPRDLWAWPKCSNWVSAVAVHRGIYARARVTEQTYRREYTRRSRTEWRLTARDLLKSTRADVKDSEVLVYQHRRSALWDAH